jgi:hypothetical protein
MVLVKRAISVCQAYKPYPAAMISGETSSVAQNPDFGTAMTQMIEIINT